MNSNDEEAIMSKQIHPGILKNSLESLGAVARKNTVQFQKTLNKAVGDMGSQFDRHNSLKLTQNELNASGAISIMSRQTSNGSYTVKSQTG